MKGNRRLWSSLITTNAAMLLSLLAACATTKVSTGADDAIPLTYNSNGVAVVSSETAMRRVVHSERLVLPHEVQERQFVSTRVEICVDVEGVVQGVTLVKSGHPEWDRNVVTATKNWRFKPLHP